MQKNVLAFDLGASSGRAILGVYKDEDFQMEEIHRFPNVPVEQDGVLYWDLHYLFEQIKKGLELACDLCEIDSLAIDTWGVDFGLIDEEGNCLGKPVHYRDTRTQGMLKEVETFISSKELYERTGNQLMEINTLFQLLALKQQQPELLEKTKDILLMPDLFNYLLTGKKRAEVSIASTTQMLNSKTKTWDVKLLEKLQIPTTILPEIVQEGNHLGKVKREFINQEVEVLNISAHDTASAVVSVPAQERFLFISCGTWSLVGTELEQPVLSEKAYEYNFSNETGQGGTTRFLKNCTGLWIVQELKRNFEERGEEFTFSEIAEMAQQAEAFICLFDTDDEMFATPGDMIERIRAYAKKTNQTSPNTPAEFFRSAYESLAMKYRGVFNEISEVTGFTFDTVNIVGGGSQAKILCQMVANASGKKVIAGPKEATAIGNLAIQLMAHGVFEDIHKIREWVSTLEETIAYQPEEIEKWAEFGVVYERVIACDK
ncbi:L-fuculokinase [Pilibacter termitis]|uniref:L-fuculokinase n=1 Tax=Pilibacter termitis TaxID=263852 RepID=A0A1T4LR95_9ENTE|nr:rhamnulokinase family protein [Pilibacter termitis]SJZ56964.1 L-fuculokinase [Pilibacter termitis]